MMTKERYSYIKEARQIGAVLTLIVAIWYAAGRSQHDESQVLQDTTAESAVSELYVTVNDGSFSVDGRQIYPYGSTMYPYWDHEGKIVRGEGWSSPDFTQYIDFIISMSDQANLNTIRPTNYFDGVTSTNDHNWWQNPTVWGNMDHLIATAQEHNKYVLLDLSSFRDRLLKAGAYPYNPGDWHEFLSFVGNRYRNSPNILNYAIAGEVACPNGHESLRPKSTDELTGFYKDISETLHGVDPNHLISTGGLSHLNENNCGIDWQSIFGLPAISMTAIHVYSEGDRTITVPRVSSWAKENHKPFTVEEFGYKQDMGDDARAEAYMEQFSLFQNNGAKAIVFWNLGPEVAPTSYELSPNTPKTWEVVKQQANKK